MGVIGGIEVEPGEVKGGPLAYIELVGGLKVEIPPSVKRFREKLNTD